MFPSNGLNPFPQYYFTSSSTPIDQQVDSDDFNFLHPESSTLSSPFYFHNNQIPQTNLINLGSTVSNTMTNYDHYQSYLGKKPARKDQHSKIHTAHGLRDRRVRLSIEIAREFFDLQDKLGFDKASKTVEWLLNKSEKDIMELANTKLSVNNINRAAAKSLNFSSTNSDCGGVLEMNTDDHNDEDPEGQVLASKSKSLMGVSKLDENIIMKDSRSAKARARARERTREKTMNTKRTWNCQQYSSSSKNY